MSKNICRLDGNQIFLSVLRDDEEAVGLYAKWMSDETTCVFIEHAHSVVDITRMPGWVRDHSVMRMGIVLKETDIVILTIELRICQPGYPLTSEKSRCVEKALEPKSCRYSCGTALWCWECIVSIWMYWKRTPLPLSVTRRQDSE